MGKFKYREPDPIQLHLRRVDHDHVMPNAERNLAPLAAAIRSSCKWIDQAVDSGPDDYADAVVDDETWVIEDLLGTTFVVCQRYISTIATRVEEFQTAYAKITGKTLNGLPKRRKELLRLPPTVPLVPVPAAEAINCLANYFKHGAEWDVMWQESELSHVQKPNVKVLRALGLEPMCSGNFRQGARALGNKDFTGTRVFIDLIESWRAGIVTRITSELP